MAVESRGFSLVEVLVATTIAVVAVAALARFAAIGAAANRTARDATMAAVLARQKIEQLRALAWGFDANGQPLTDTTTNVAVWPEEGSGGPGLAASAPDSLTRNVAGSCDFLDGSGRPLGGGAVPPSATTYTRRWNVAALAAAPDRTIVVQVAVFAYPRQAPLARLVAVRTRKVP